MFKEEVTERIGCLGQVFRSFVPCSKVVLFFLFNFIFILLSDCDYLNLQIQNNNRFNTNLPSCLVNFSGFTCPVSLPPQVFFFLPSYYTLLQLSCYTKYRENRKKSHVNIFLNNLHNNMASWGQVSAEETHTIKAEMYNVTPLQVINPSHYIIISTFHKEI